ncbi:hypothetical protein ANN_01011 [Periplaneta americana]|uniref:Major facilitator superfamily (MFS) profile domain-containing protein n=1 Tax=Periplaneta americana TaxID=6978 RepID=A0ABQ8TSD9_PERAM|nr:hypothetical protein ANN_01011 [Periplaneta americana]
MSTLKFRFVVAGEVQEFEWDSKMKGHLLSSFFYGYLVTQIPGGWLAGRLGGNMVFGLGVAVTAFLTLVTPPIANASYYAFLAVRVVEGFFEALNKEKRVLAFLRQKFPRVSEAKLIAGIFDGLQIRELMNDAKFNDHKKDKESNAWLALKSIIKNCLGKRRSSEYKHAVEELLQRYQALGACSLPPCKIIYITIIAATGVAQSVKALACRFEVALGRGCQTIINCKLILFLQGFTYPCIHAVWARWAPPLERSKLATLAFSGSYVGTVVALPVSGILAQKVGWPFVFYVFGEFSY